MNVDYRAVFGITMAAGLCLCPVASAQATAGTDSSKPAAAASTTTEDDKSLSAILARLKKNTPDNDAQAKTAKQDTKEKDNKKKEKDRFVPILQDNGFVYTLDTKNAHWIPMPHSGNEYIADVWVRLVQTDGDTNTSSYSYPQKYYLEHYYIRPKTQQIQFLCELEVTGRPENAIQERPYKNSNWENLVPGSIEDEIYHKVLQTMKKNHIGGNSSNGMSVRDAVEEYLRISL